MKAIDCRNELADKVLSQEELNALAYSFVEKYHQQYMHPDSQYQDIIEFYTKQELSEAQTLINTIYEVMQNHEINPITVERTAKYLIYHWLRKQYQQNMYVDDFEDFNEKIKETDDDKLEWVDDVNEWMEFDREYLMITVTFFESIGFNNYENKILLAGKQINDLCNNKLDINNLNNKYNKFFKRKTEPGLDYILEI